MDSDLEWKRLREQALRAKHTGLSQYTRFMDPAMAVRAVDAARECRVECALYGGYEEAERVMAAFYARENPPVPEDYPMRALRIEWNAKFAHPAHRDLLGAAMGLGINRDAMGDIALGERRGAPCAWIFVTQETADYVAANLNAAGRAALRTSLTDEPPQIAPPEGEEMRVTVQHARLDAVLAAGYRLSRAEAQRLVAAGLVKLNHEINLRADARVGEGDLISARGHGRLRVLSEAGESRRGRLVMRLFRYGR